MKRTFVLLAAILILSACSTTNVKRVDADKQIDLSGYWNDTDVRLVCNALIKDCLASPRVDQAIRSKQRTPTVIVGSFRNESSEHIDTAIISSTMETVIFNSGRLNFVVGGDVRDEIRIERQDQQSNASASTVTAMRNETGADFMLNGTVRSIVDTSGNRTVRTYFVYAQLTNIETNQRLWMAENSEIKKEITTPKSRL
jgi:uncharacterized protein (TIGR02722 family)